MHQSFYVLLRAITRTQGKLHSKKYNNNMNTIQFIQSTLFELYRSFVTEVEPLTDEEKELIRQRRDQAQQGLNIQPFPQLQ